VRQKAIFPGFYSLKYFPPKFAYLAIASRFDTIRIVFIWNGQDEKWRKTSFVPICTSLDEEKT
jgi:hypothetical protein